MKEYTPREEVARGLQTKSCSKQRFITNAASSSVSRKHYNASLIHVLAHSSYPAHHLCGCACFNTQTSFINLTLNVYSGKGTFLCIGLKIARQQEQQHFCGPRMWVLCVSLLLVLYTEVIRSVRQNSYPSYLLYAESPMSETYVAT